MKLLKRVLLIAIFSALYCSRAFAAEHSIDSFDAMVGQLTSENIASAIVLTDANLITLGVVNFDPSSVIDFGDINTGDQASLQRRKELKTYSLPWRSDWHEVSPTWQTSTYAKLSYVGSSQTIDFSQPIKEGQSLTENSYLLQVEQRWQRQLSQNWQVQLGIGSQLVWYQNSFQYPGVLEQLKPLFNNVLLNTSYGALMIDPSLEFSYENYFYGNKWQFISGYRYAIGQTFAVDSKKQQVTPQVGRFTNTLMFHYQLPQLAENENELRFIFKRIDLSGDGVDPLATDHYYEVGAGWVLDTPWLTSWVDNLGIGVTVNVGSVLSGGSILLLFNEDI